MHVPVLPNRRMLPYSFRLWVGGAWVPCIAFSSEAVLAAAPTGGASGAAELHLAADSDPCRARHGEQRSGFIIGCGLGNAFAAVAAGFPGCDDAAFSRARPPLYPCRHPAQQDRCSVEAIA